MRNSLCIFALIILTMTGSLAHAAGAASTLTLPVKFVFHPKLSDAVFTKATFVDVDNILAVDDKPFAIKRSDGTLRRITDLTAIVDDLTQEQVATLLEAFTTTVNLLKTKNGSLKGLYDDNTDKFGSEFTSLFGKYVSAIDEDFLERVETMLDELAIEAFEILVTEDMYIDTDLLMSGSVSYQEVFEMAAVGVDTTTSASYDTSSGTLMITTHDDYSNGTWYSSTTYYYGDGSSKTYNTWGDETGQTGNETSDEDSAGENFIDALFGEQDITAESEAGRLSITHNLATYTSISIFEKATTLPSLITSYTSDSITAAIFKKQFAATVSKALTNNTRLTQKNLSATVRVR